MHLYCILCFLDVPFMVNNQHRFLPQVYRHFPTSPFVTSQESVCHRAVKGEQSLFYEPHEMYVRFRVEKIMIKKR
jgi:hypothetical protein